MPPPTTATHLVKVLTPRVLAAATDHARSRAGEAIHP